MAPRPSPTKTPLTALRSIGPTTVARLEAVGLGVHWLSFPESVREQMRAEVLARGPLPGLDGTPK